MAKTIHVYPSNGGWAVKQEGTKSSMVFPTQKKAIASARAIARDSAPSQLVVYGREGRIRRHVTHGLPKVQDPPSRSRGAKEIEKAVGRVALERVTSDPQPRRG
ncbi:MAG: DUF2188 domain-containing protein [bacterium]|nr:DUF2188 domain-containing protein [bacterium]